MPPLRLAQLKESHYCSVSLPLHQSLKAILAQENADDKENVLYYLIQILVGSKERYSPIEKGVFGINTCSTKFLPLLQYSHTKLI